jgi:hypothetical protein
MTRLDLKQIDLQLEHEINHLSQSTFVIYRDAIREDGHQAISDLKKDIELWVNDLNNRVIACYELERLLNAKRSVVKLHRLKNKGIDVESLETFKNDVLRVIAKAIMNSYLESLFRNQEFEKVRNEEIFDN